jgi:hypothetical protein
MLFTLDKTSSIRLKIAKRIYTTASRFFTVTMAVRQPSTVTAEKLSGLCSGHGSYKKRPCPSLNG